VDEPDVILHDLFFRSIGIFGDRLSRDQSAAGGPKSIAGIPLQNSDRLIWYSSIKEIFA